MLGSSWFGGDGAGTGIGASCCGGAIGLKLEPGGGT